MGTKFAPLVLCLLIGCSNAERPDTFAAACAVPGSDSIEGEDKPRGGDVVLDPRLTAEESARVEAGFLAWTEATRGAVQWRLRRASGPLLQYGSVNVVVCPAGAPRFVDPSGRHAGGSASGDVVAIARDRLGESGLEALSAHEAGHALGLGDTDGPDEIMNPSLAAPSPSPADVVALEALWW